MCPADCVPCSLEEAASDLKRTFPLLHPQRIHDQRKRRRVLAAAWVVKVVAREGWTPVLEYAHQAAFFDVRREFFLRQERDAHAAEGCQHDMERGIEDRLALE